MEDEPFDPKFARESLLSLTLPTDYKYLIENVASSEQPFRAVFRIAGIDTPEAASKWVTEYSEKNQVTWRMRASHNPKGRTVLWKKDLRCERNTDNRSRKSSNRLTKNTNCPAKLKMTMKKYRNKSKEKKPDPFKKDWPCVVELINLHNHSTDFNPRFRPPSEETKQKLIEMFHQGHSPTSAWRAIWTQLVLKHPEDYEVLINDGRYLPTVSVCTHLFHQAMKDKTRIINCRVADDSLKESLLKRLDEYTKSMKGRAVYGSIGDGNYLALCTPLMCRAHTLLRQSSEVVILDVYTRMEPLKRKRPQKVSKDLNQVQQELGSNVEPGRQSSKERPTLYVYCLLTSTPAGNIPLGIIICDSSSDDVLQKGLESLQECFPSTAFFSKPQPHFFVLNTAYKEGSPLQVLYPQSGIVLSHSYLLQSAWTWLCDSKKNKIMDADRHELYYGIRKLLSAQNDQELAEIHWNLKCHPSAQKYPKFQSYLESLFHMRGLWATFYCPGVANQNTFMNNYIQMVFKVFKDCILHQIRASSMNQLFDVLSTELESYMESTIIDFCYNHFPKTLVKFLPSASAIDLNKVVPHVERQDCYLVPKEKDPLQCHFVYLNNAACSCLASSTGRLCKHVSAVLHKFSESSAYTSCDLVKKIMYEVATGKQAPSSWEPPVIPNIIYEVGDTVEDCSPVTMDETSSDMSPVQSIRKPCALTPEIENSKKILKSIFNKFETCINVNPIIFIPAIKQMGINFEALQSEVSLAKAAQNFGLHSQPNPAQNNSNLRNTVQNIERRQDEVNNPLQVGNNLKAITTNIVNKNQNSDKKRRTLSRTKSSDSSRSDSENVSMSSSTDGMLSTRRQMPKRYSGRNNIRTAPYFVPIAPKPGGPKPNLPTVMPEKSEGPKLIKGNVQNAPVFFVVDNKD